MVKRSRIYKLEFVIYLLFALRYLEMLVTYLNLRLLIIVVGKQRKTTTTATKRKKHKPTNNIKDKSFHEKKTLRT